MDFQTPRINFTVLQRSLIHRLRVSVLEGKCKAQESSKFHQQGFMWQLQSSAVSGATQHPIKGQCRGWMLEGSGKHWWRLKGD